jgi:RNA polymerase sigma-70 factor, ECF subfamily
LFSFFHKKNITTYTDEALVKELNAGNEAAFNLLYQRYHIVMFRYLLRLLGQDKEKAEDFLQELFMKVLHASASFNPNQKFNTWLYTIATNMCRNEWRNQTNRRRLMQQFEPWEKEPAKTVAEKIDEKMQRHILYELLEQLNDRDQEMMVLRFQQELSIREIAQIFGIPEGTVKSRIFYLLKNISRQVKA